MTTRKFAGHEQSAWLRSRTSTLPTTTWCTHLDTEERPPASTRFYVPLWLSQIMCAQCVLDQWNEDICDRCGKVEPGGCWTFWAVSESDSDPFEFVFALCHHCRGLEVDGRA